MLITQIIIIALLVVIIGMLWTAITKLGLLINLQPSASE
jgi:hypothetical protein